jgi:hypothetical protein
MIPEGLLANRDLIHHHGDAYRHYRHAVPMLVPSVRQTDRSTIAAVQPEP